MRNLGFYVFFSIVMLVYTFLNYYIIKRGMTVVVSSNYLKLIWIWSVIFLASSFVMARIAERFSVNFFTTTLIWIGSFWLAIMVYIVLQLAIIDILSIINKFVNFFPEFIFADIVKTKHYTALTILTTTLLIVLFGHLNTWFPKIKELKITINKEAGKIKNLSIVVFSDLHLGSIIETRYLNVIKKKVNSLNPDLILIPGDIIDEDITPVIKNNLGEILSQFKAKYGVYAVTGNHEYIGGINKAKKYLEEHNIKLLNDTAVLIEDSFYLIGREDRSIFQFTGKKRKELTSIISEIDKNKPLILLDHQPFNLNEAQEAGIDLQLSGHTHHGQIWPFNYITDLIFEKSSGYLKKRGTNYYISSGIGGWGPPIRTSSRPEIVKINILFDGL